MNENLSPIQKVLLETFKAFAELCKEHGITYFAAYGTLLGAIRHKGFIPWDDDIDVYLLREDYDKLLSLKKCLKDTNYRVADFHDDGYPYPFAKFYDSTKTFWEYRQFPLIMGPFIDLFPLDESGDHKVEHEKLCDDIRSTFWLYRKSVSFFTWKEIYNDIVSMNGYEGPIKFVIKLMFVPQKQRFRQRAERIFKKACSVRGNYYKPYWDLSHIQFPKEWFTHTQVFPFEDTEIFVPNGYHELLTYLYKDYMTPPPVLSRTGHHRCYYLNLERRIDRDEILREKGNEEQEKKPMSLSVIWNEVRHWKGFN